jgi:hypothetical protein
MRRVLITALGLAAVLSSSAHASDIIYGTTATSLVRFNASSPGTINATVPISGLPAGVTVSGLDQRPRVDRRDRVSGCERIARPR